MSCMLRRDRKLKTTREAAAQCLVQVLKVTFFQKILAARRATHHFCLQALLELVPTKTAIAVKEITKLLE